MKRFKIRYKHFVNNLKKLINTKYEYQPDYKLSQLNYDLYGDRVFVV